MRKKIDMTMSTISIFSLCVMALFFYAVVRYRPWVGDDVLHCFDGGLFFYVYPDTVMNEQNLGDFFNSFQQAFLHAKDYYLNWGGRVITGITDPLMVWGGKTFSGVVSLITFLGILLAGLRLVYKSLQQIFLHPLSVVCAGALMLFYNRAIGDAIMRTMVNLYGFSFLLYLMLINLNEDYLKQDEISKRKILVINLLGFLAGLSHELLGVWFIFQLLLKTIIVRKSIKGLFIHCKCFIGLFIGYSICFIAPGNFVRAGNPHEAGLNSPIIGRLIRSITSHRVVLFEFEAIGRGIFVGMLIGTVISFIFLCYKRQYKYLLWIVEMVTYILVSVVLWSVVARVPARGIYVTMFYVLLILLKVIYEAEKILEERHIILEALALIVMVGVLYDCCSWIPSMVEQAQNRENLIETAAENQEKEVYVPTFSEDCNRIIFLKQDVDSQYELDWLYYKRMYGVHVKLEE